MPPHPIPQPRVDSLVIDPATGEQRRRTEYSGTAWYGSPPDTSGMIVAFTAALVQEDAAFFLPDSLPYRRAQLEGGVVACSVALQGKTERTTYLSVAEASWADDPRDDDTSWLQLRLSVYGYTPLAVAYRVVAQCRPGALL